MSPSNFCPTLPLFSHQSRKQDVSNVSRRVKHGIRNKCALVITTSEGESHQPACTQRHKSKGAHSHECFRLTETSLSQN